MSQSTELYLTYAWNETSLTFLFSTMVDKHLALICSLLRLKIFILIFPIRASTWQLKRYQVLYLQQKLFSFLSSNTFCKNLLISFSNKYFVYDKIKFLKCRYITTKYCNEYFTHFPIE